MNDEIQKGQWWNLWWKDKIKMTKKQKQSNEDWINQPTNQPWLEMTTFKTEQKHEKQEENKKITEIDEKQKKIDGNDWNRWVSRIHKKTQ